MSRNRQYVRTVEESKISANNDGVKTEAINYVRKFVDRKQEKEYDKSRR